MQVAMVTDLVGGYGIGHNILYNLVELTCQFSIACKLVKLVNYGVRPEY